MHKDGTKTAKCDRCDETDIVADTGSKIPHTFDRQVTEEKYLATAATKESAATYYYSCACGEKGTETSLHTEIPFRSRSRST